MDKKTYTAKMSFKAETPGEFEAVFATLNVMDKDRDVTIPGAFSKQPVLVEPWNHDYTNLPVGRGVIEEHDNEARIAGKFFLETAAGIEHHFVVKELGDMQEWSYTFNVLEAEFGKFNGEDVRFLKKMDVIGVAPVMRGAGENTRTTAIKGKKSGEAEGETGDGKPSGTSPDVIRSEIDILEMELED